MGRLGSLIMALVFIDLLFLITGGLNVNAPSSIILGVITDPSTIKTSNFWDLSILTLVGLAVIAGIYSRLSGGAPSDALKFIPIAIGISALIVDFLYIYNELRALNEVLATLVMAPIVIMFAFAILEWVRGKD